MTDKISQAHTMSDILELAKQAGFTIHPIGNEIIVRHSNGSWVDLTEKLEAFANLIRADDSEQCAECQWISVEDRLPEDLTRTNYLTVSVIGSMTPKTVVKLTSGRCDACGFRFNLMDWERVTHWMPLPNPPQAMSEKG